MLNKMNYKIVNKTNRVINISILVLLIIFILISIVIAMTQTPVAEDMSFKKFINDNNLLEFYKYHYLNDDGRFISIFLMPVIIYNKFTYLIFGIINAIVFFIEIYLINKIVLGRKPLIFTKDKLLFVITIVFIWYFLPVLEDVSAWGQCINWRTASVGYLYPTLFMLLFIQPFINLLKNEKQFFYFKNRILNSLSIFILGFVSAASNQQIFTGLFIVLFFVILFLKIYKKRKISLFLITGIIGFIIGGIFIAVAPANFTGARGVDKIPNFSIINNLEHYFLYLKYFFISLKDLLFIAIFFLIYKTHSIYQKDKKINYSVTIFFLLLTFASTFVFIIIPQMYFRTFWYPVIFLCISVFSIIDYNSSFYKKINKNLITNIFLLFLLIFILKDSAIGIINNYSLQKQVAERENIIRQAKTNNKKTVKIRQLELVNHSRTTFLSDEKVWLLYYYDLDSIVFINSNENKKND